MLREHPLDQPNARVMVTELYLQDIFRNLLTDPLKTRIPQDYAACMERLRSIDEMYKKLKDREAGTSIAFRIGQITREVKIIEQGIKLGDYATVVPHLAIAFGEINGLERTLELILLQESDGNE